MSAEDATNLDDDLVLLGGRAIMARLEAGGSTAVPDDLWAALEGRVLVVAVAGVAVRGVDFPEAQVVDALPRGVIGLAVGFRAGEEARPRALLRALSERLEASARVAAAVAPGTITARCVLGPAPEAALGVLSRHEGPGIYVSEEARALVSGPLSASGADHLLVRRPLVRRRPWLIAAPLLAAAGLLAAFLPRLLAGPPPRAVIQILSQRAPENVARGAASEGGLRLTQGDLVHVRVDVQPGTQVTLLVFDSDDQLSVTAAEPGSMIHGPERPAGDQEQVVNRASTDEGSPPRRGVASPPRARPNEVLRTWMLDERPGIEQVLAVVTRSAWESPGPLLAEISGRAALTRAARLDALEDALKDQLGASEVSLIRGAEIQHLPR